MRSRCLFLFVSLVGIVGVGDLPVMASGFNEQLKSFESEGYKLVVPVRSDALATGEPASITVPLKEKHEYNLLLECTGTCSRLSVGVLDPAGVELLPVFHDKPLTFAFVEVVATGPHTVAVTAAPCPEGTCRVRFAAVGRGVDAPIVTPPPPPAPPPGTRPGTPTPPSQAPSPVPVAQSMDHATAEDLIARVFGDVAAAVMSVAEAQAARDRASLQQPDRVPQPARTPSEAPGKAADVALGQPAPQPARASQPATAEMPRRSTVDCIALHEQTTRRIWAVPPGPGSAEKAQALQAGLQAKCPGY